MTKEECEIETSKAIMEMRSRIVELEKENAQLKKQQFSLKNELNTFLAQNAEMKKQVEQMKCCENCIHNYYDDEDSRHCNVLNQHQMIMFKKCDKWELEE